MSAIHHDSHGLEPNEKVDPFLRVSPGANLTWPEEDSNLTYFIPSGIYIYTQFSST